MESSISSVIIVSFKMTKSFESVLKCYIPRNLSSPISENIHGYIKANSVMLSITT